MKFNKKGFTLVELIVVMAIIAVLAAILVPTMLGFMKQAKYTEANANAKSIYTAVNTVVADYRVYNKAFVGPGFIIPQNGTKLTDEITIGQATPPYKLKWSDYLEGMKGKGYAKLNQSKTGIQYVRWSLGDPYNVGKANGINSDRKDSLDAMVLRSAQQSGTAKDADGNPLGGYPLA